MHVCVLRFSTTVSHIAGFVRTIFQVSILPLEFFVVVVLGTLVINPVVLGTKVVPLKHPQTGEILRIECLKLIKVPKKLIFNDKTEAASKRVDHLFHLSCAFGFMYPCFGALFFNCGVVVQAILVPVFFLLRSCFEYSADSITAKTFGSDAMPVRKR